MASEQAQVVPSALDDMRGVHGQETVTVAAADWTATQWVRGFYLEADGTVACTFVDGTTGTLAGLLGGIVYPFKVKSIQKTGTLPATGIHVLY